MDNYKEIKRILIPAEEKEALFDYQEGTIKCGSERLNALIGEELSKVMGFTINDLKTEFDACKLTMGGKFRCPHKSRVVVHYAFTMPVLENIEVKIYRSNWQKLCDVCDEKDFNSEPFLDSTGVDEDVLRELEAIDIEKKKKEENAAKEAMERKEAIVAAAKKNALKKIADGYDQMIEAGSNLVSLLEKHKHKNPVFIERQNKIMHDLRNDKELFTADLQ